MKPAVTGADVDAPTHGLALRSAEPLPRGSWQVIHGTPITPARLVADLAPTGFCLSYHNRCPVEPYLAKLHPDATLLLDNGSFSAWMRGMRETGQPPPAPPRAHWDGFYGWAMGIANRVPQAVLVVPDVIGGTEAENRDLMLSIPPGVPHDRCAGVWHLDEGMDHLDWICDAFGIVAFGSAGRFRSPGTQPWRQRVDQALRRIEARCSDPANGCCRPRLHMLRGLGPMRFGDTWFASADSTNLARNHAQRAPGPGGLRRMQERLESRRYPDPPGPTWPDPCPGPGTPPRGGAALQLAMLQDP